MSCRRTTADRLLGQIYLWIFEGQKCGIVLRELSKELESLGTEDSGLCRRRLGTVWILLIAFGLVGVGSVGFGWLVGLFLFNASTEEKRTPWILLIPLSLVGVGLFSFIGLCRTKTSASASNVELKAKLEKDEIKGRKCSKTEEKIVQLNEELKSESRQKNPDDVDRHVLAELLKALVKPDGLTDPCSVCAIQQFVNDFEKNRLMSECFREAMTHLVIVLQFFDINVSFAANQIKRDTMLHVDWLD